MDIIALVAMIGLTAICAVTLIAINKIRLLSWHELAGILSSEYGALTLTEADKYSTNEVLIGVAETSMDRNPMLQLLPFVPIRGIATQYQRENAAANPAFVAPGGAITESTPTTSQITVALKVLIGDADVDKFLKTTRSNQQDLEAELIAIKARNFADYWGDKIIYGSIDADANEFDGLHEIISDDVSAQQVHAGSASTPGVGTFTLLDQLVDLVRPAPTCLIMSRRSRRGIQKLARSQGWDLPLTDAGGAINRPVVSYADIPILIADFITDVETISSSAFATKTGGASSSIFAMRFDEAGLFGMSAEDPEATDTLENIIQLEPIGTLEGKDANRWRLKHYGAMALKDSQALARLDGISSGDWTN